MNTVQFEILIMAGAASVYNIPSLFVENYVGNNVTLVEDNNMTSWNETLENMGITFIRRYTKFCMNTYVKVYLFSCCLRSSIFISMSNLCVTSKWLNAAEVQ